jgi:hypothetical protein
VLDEVAEVNAALSKARKKRVVPDSVATPEEVAGYTLVGSYAVHSASKGGIADIDLHPQQVGEGSGCRRGALRCSGGILAQTLFFQGWECVCVCVLGGACRVFVCVCVRVRICAWIFVLAWGSCELAWGSCELVCVCVCVCVSVFVSLRASVCSSRVS